MVVTELVEVAAVIAVEAADAVAVEADAGDKRKEL